MDLSKPGPLYEAIRYHISGDSPTSLSDRISKVGMRLRDLESRVGPALSRLEVLEGTVKGLEHRTNHQTVEDRLNAMEERLEKMPKPRSRAKPAEKPASKPTTKAKPKPS